MAAVVFLRRPTTFVFLSWLDALDVVQDKGKNDDGVKRPYMRVDRHYHFF